MHRGVNLFAHALQNAKQAGGFVGIGCGALACKVPFHEFVIRLVTEEAPRHNAAGVDEVLYKVVGLGHGMAFKGGLRQIVQAFKTAALHQLCQATLQCHFQTRVRAKRCKHAACARVH